MESYQWDFIKDLPSGWEKEIGKSELKGLVDIWKKNRARLEQSDVVKQFNEKLKRKWAIETGIIENLYTLDRGTTLVLVEKGIVASFIPHDATNKPVDEIIGFLKDQESALDGLFDYVAERRNLSTSFIKELHSLFTRNQSETEAIDMRGGHLSVPLIKGDWKRLPNNPKRSDGAIHCYCPPEHVSAEMDHLIKLHLDHESNDVPPEVEAAWLHHRFTQIHPFQDGNGRVARALASLVFIKHELFPLVIDRSARGEYIAALEAADQGTLSQLVDLFVKIQKKSVLEALSLVTDVLMEKGWERRQQIVSSAMERLKARKQQELEAIQSKAFEVSGKLEKVAFSLASEIVTDINDELHQIDRNYHAGIARSDDNNNFWFKNQIVGIARDLGYFADFRAYRSWIRMKIREDKERVTEIVFSFHGLGFDFVGLMAVSAFIEFRDRGEDNETTVDGPHKICEEVFQFSYLESLDDLTPRFKNWFNDSVLIGLELWRRQL